MTQPEPVVESQGLSEAALVALEVAFAVLVLAAITKFLARARDLVMAPWRAGGGLPDPSGILTLDTYWSSLVDGLMDDLVRAAKVGWDDAADQLNVNIPFNPSDPILLEQLDATRNLLVNVDFEVYTEAVKAISVGMDSGAGNAAIAARIDDILNISGTTNWPNRADVIARTEIRRFTSAGQISAAMRYSAITGTRLIKEWVDRDDNRVRPAHARADGQVRELSDLFDVGGSRLLYPGHPSGLPADVINERCRMKIREARR